MGLILKKIQSGTRKLTNIGNFPFWCAGAVTGLAASGYALVFKYAANYGHTLFLNSPRLWWGIAPILFFCSVYLVKRFSPEASGSGIPQVMASILHSENSDSTWLNRLLGLRVAMVKVASSLLAALAGGTIGREGPTIQIGASLFTWIGKKMKRDLTAEERQAFILAGGAAGLAAAFNTPLGGIVFAIEELARDAFRAFRTSVLLGVIVSGVAAQWVLGSYLYLGKPESLHVDWISIGFSLLLGASAGAAGAGFGRVLFYSMGKVNHLSSKIGMLGVFILLMLITGACAFLTKGDSLGPGIEQITHLLLNQQSIEWWMIPLRFISTVTSYLFGSAGGIFSPSLTIGAEIGRWIAELLRLNANDSSLFVMLGMVGFMSGMSYAPFTSLVLVLEMTDCSNAIFPMMLSAVTALEVAHLIHPHSFYERASRRYLH